MHSFLGCGVSGPGKLLVCVCSLSVLVSMGKVQPYSGVLPGCQSTHCALLWASLAPHAVLAARMAHSSGYLVRTRFFSWGDKDLQVELRMFINTNTKIRGLTTHRNDEFLIVPSPIVCETVGQCILSISEGSGLFFLQSCIYPISRGQKCFLPGE